jgi:hypothetical protein
MKKALIYPTTLASLLLGLTWASLVYAAEVVPVAQRLGGGVVFNEILPDPSIGGDTNCTPDQPSAQGFDTNGNGCVDQRDEFVELYNMSDQPIDIGGWQLWTKGDDNWFTFTVGTVIQPKGYVVVVSNMQGGTLPGVPAETVFSVGKNKLQGNSGENIVLLNPASKEFIQIKFTGVITPQATHDPPAPTSGYKDFPPDAVRISMVDFGTSASGYSLARILPGYTQIITQGQYISPGATPGSYMAVGMASQGQMASSPSVWLWLGTAALLFWTGRSIRRHTR